MTDNDTSTPATPVSPSESPHDDDLIVDWDGPSDPLDPKNWPYNKKWMATVIVSLFTFVSPVSSSMVAPSSAVIAGQFGVTSDVLISMTTSIFVLAFAIGPLFLGPLSEMYGRMRILQGANLFYFVWNLACGFAHNEEELIAFRFLAGIGGSAPLAIGAGILGDIWRAEERGRAVAIYSLAPLLGPVIGPVCGAWITEKSTWRWVFWSTSILTIGVQLLGLHFLRETYAPVLLEQKAARTRADMDTEKGDPRHVRTIYEKSGDRSWKGLLAKALFRPFALFAREPIVQLLGVYMAFIYGIFYLFLVTIPAIFSDIYKQSIGIAGLNYISLGIGLTVASQVNARYMDRIYVYLKKRNNGVGEPEFRVPAMVPGSLILPIGLLLAGWSAEKRLHWIAVNIGMALVGGGMILNFQSMQTYIIDSFTLHAASALAAVSFLRALAGFAFPLFAPSMYKAVGYGWGGTILALAVIVVGCPAPFLFWRFGKQVRMKSRYKS